MRARNYKQPCEDVHCLIPCAHKSPSKNIEYYSARMIFILLPDRVSEYAPRLIEMETYYALIKINQYELSHPCTDHDEIITF